MIPDALELKKDCALYLENSKGQTFTLSNAKPHANFDLIRIKKIDK